MRTITLDSKPYLIPETWEEVTLEQFLKFNTGLERSLDLISIFTLPVDQLSNLKDLKAIDEIELCLSFLNTPMETVPEKKERFVFNGVEVSLPSDIGESSIGQYQDLKHWVSEYFKEEDDNTVRRMDTYAKIISIYLQPILDKSTYDFKRAEELSIDIYKCSAVEVARFGSFFIQKFLELRTGTKTNAQNLATPQKK